MRWNTDPAETAGHTSTLATAPEQTGAESAKRALHGRDLERQLLTELLDELRILRTTSSEHARSRRGQVLNGVLEVAQWRFDADGIITRTFEAQVGSVIIANASGSSVTYQTGSNGGTSAPTTGRGVQVIPTGTFFAIPVGAHAFTLYGASGTTVAVQAFTGLQAFGVRL